MIELARAVQAESAVSRWQAIEKFNREAQLNSADGAALSALVKALGDEHPFVRWQAGLALSQPKFGWEKLVEVLRNNSNAKAGPESERARSAAVDALAGQTSPEINAALIDILQTGDARLRQAAAEALAHRGNLEAATPLLVALNDVDPWVRRAAAYALGHIGDQSAAGVLIGKLVDEAVIVRRSAAYALGALRAVVGQSRLRAALADPDPQVRRNAAWALGRIGQPEAVPALRQLLTDEALAGTIAQTAQHAIDAITKPAWLQFLRELRGRFQ
jgi:HEAT repeat protein